METLKEFSITEHGFAMDGSDKVSVPACRIKATSYLEAANILTTFLKTRVKPDCMQLLTPIERIEFE